MDILAWSINKSIRVVSQTIVNYILKSIKPKEILQVNKQHPESITIFLKLWK